MSLQQMDDFTFKHSSQIDAIYTEYTANQIKSLFDSRGIELRTFINALITTLSSADGAGNIGSAAVTDLEGTTIQAMLQSIRDKLKATADGTSGADFINATAISGLTGSTVQALLESLKAYADALTADDIESTPISAGSGSTVHAQLVWLLGQIAAASTGTIVDGSIGEIKLAPELAAKINNALSNEGLLSTLLTTDKSSLVNAINENLTIPLATGTATAITLSLPTLEDHYTKTFIASLDNSGSATTINGKNLYKPNTQTPPTLKAGKAYTVWYDNDLDCFFIKASAEGNTIASHVLADDTFSNDTDTGIVGTMPNNSSPTATITTQGGTVTIPLGYNPGGTITANLSNLSDSIILKGQTVGGVVGTATSDATATASTIVSGSTAYVNGLKLTGTATVSSLGGKNYAEGSGTCNSGNCVVSGLAFTPTKIQIISGGYRYYYSSDFDTYIHLISSSSANNISVSSGFNANLVAGSYGTTFTWKAYD